MNAASAIFVKPELRLRVFSEESYANADSPISRSDPDVETVCSDVQSANADAPIVCVILLLLAWL